MKKRITKIIFSFLLVLLIIFACNNEMKATDKFIQGAEDFMNAGTKDMLNTSAIKNTSNTIFNVFAVIGTAAVLIVGTVLGIKLITGSIEEKAKVKEVLTPYIISSIVIFAAFGIWALAVNVFQNIF